MCAELRWSTLSSSIETSTINCLPEEKREDVMFLIARYTMI